MFAEKEEDDFFMSHLSPDKKVLEYGSGISTIEISKLCSSILSMEHQKVWYEKLSIKLPDNCTLVLRQPDLPYEEGFDDGTYEEFRSYVDHPVDKGLFDIILIDGRARVACASKCHQMTNENSDIFIHDFYREEYKGVLDYLTLIEQVGSMAKFRSKAR